MEITYNTPFHVTANQYAALMNRFAGIVAGRYDKEEKKFYCKVLQSKYIKHVEIQLRNGV